MCFLIMHPFVPCFLSGKTTKLSLSAASCLANMETITHQGQNIHKYSAGMWGQKKALYLQRSVFVRSGNVIDLAGAGWAVEAEEGYEVPSWLSDPSFPPWGLCCTWADILAAYNRKSETEQVTHPESAPALCIHSLFSAVLSPGLMVFPCHLYGNSKCQGCHMFCCSFVGPCLCFPACPSQSSFSAWSTLCVCTLWQMKSFSTWPPLLSVDKTGVIRRIAFSL